VTSLRIGGDIGRGRIYPAAIQNRQPVRITHSHKFKVGGGKAAAARSGRGDAKTTLVGLTSVGEGDGVFSIGVPAFGFRVDE